jgi:hypothetical protein
MATVIPVRGELRSVDVPKTTAEIRRLFEEFHAGASFGLEWKKAESGEMFIYRAPSNAEKAGWPRNPRAENFIVQRNLLGSPVVYGTCVYMSADEWAEFKTVAKAKLGPINRNGDQFPELSPDDVRALVDGPRTALTTWNGTPLSAAEQEKLKDEQWTPLRGDTYPSKDTIRSRFGGRWDGRKSQWLVPFRNLKEAQAYVDSHARKNPDGSVSAKSQVYRCHKCLREIRGEPEYVEAGTRKVTVCPTSDRAECERVEREELDQNPFVGSPPPSKT